MEWRSHLKNFSQHLIANLDEEELKELRELHNVEDYLGNPPANVEHIEQTESRLGFMLPDSLRSFYLTSDGWYSAGGFPIGLANVLPVAELSLLSNCKARELGVFATYVKHHLHRFSLESSAAPLENCVVIIDLDGNEIGFTVRSEQMDDWPVVTYNPDGGNFEFYDGFIALMRDGMMG